MRPKKVVQTEVDMVTYERLRHLAEKRSVPLKSVLREAVSIYVERAEGPVEEDSLFQIVGRIGLEGRNWSERKDWRP